MKRPLKWVAEVLGRRLENASGSADVNAAADAAEAVATGWSIDSRTVAPGDVFIALRGPSHDGNRYVAQALAKGAVAAVVDGDVGEAAGPLIRVADGLRALESLARRVREEWIGDVVAVTGSAGKTTTKDVIAAMLNASFKTAKTEGNLNNHIGLPLSLLRLEEDARVAVLELGMNHAGEIRELTKLARPRIGVVTNVGSAHIENFDSIEGIAAAKRELIEELGPDGIALLNADDERVAAMAQHHKGRTVFYGMSEAADGEIDVRADDVAFSADGVRFRVGDVDFQSRLTGRHSVSNLLAGIATAGIYGIKPEALIGTVAGLQPGKMRGERISRGGITILNDCYNSNPDAAKAMLEVLQDTPATRRIAVLGEMRELGRWAEPLHRDVGETAVRCQVDVLVGIRGAAYFMLDAAKRAGLRAAAAFFFEDPAEAGELVAKIARPGDAILFKGSRGVEVERALARLLEALPETPQPGKAIEDGGAG